ncbi:glycoside hydrolase family 31 protein [Apodospora peruviana]|uniref:alpha-glucosidase n=1 Tax=Apodospora peruviana TaxID=516989 RepID=A0AAE0HWT7_9PEZI|nr:glycoside hydrolase family 31 protein [Apodospora peruviana]
MVRGLLSLFVLGHSIKLLVAQGTECSGYQAKNVVVTDSSLVAELTLAGEKCNAFGEDITNLKLTVEYQTDTRLHVLIEDVGLNVFQVQEQVIPRPKSEGATSASSLLEFSYTEKPFSFKVTRKSTGDILFDTSDVPLIFESQYVRLRTKLPQNANLYGLGEHSDDFRLPLSNYTRTLWNAESPFIPEKANLYGSHPVYFDHRGGSGTHGVFLLSSSGMDINISQTDSGQQYLEYNTIGGVLDLYFLAGPEPAAVSKQYAEVVGLPAMMPYWTLGFHQCKYGWSDINVVNEVVANYSVAKIPLEAMWGDIDYMHDHKDFTTDPDKFPLDKMRALVDGLHKNNQRYIMILDPGIHNTDASYPTYTRGAEKDVYLKAADGSFYRGRQWPGEVVWPDWFSPNTQEWWTDEIARFFDPATGIDVDGLWNDMNEASSFCADTTCFDGAASRRSLPSGHHPHYHQKAQPVSHNKRADGGDKKGLPNRNLFTPPYEIHNHRGALSASTLWTNITNSDSTTQYDTHNVYGTMMAHATRSALLSRRPKLRPFVLTRSTFAGAGRAAAHWFGDNGSTWWDYRASIRQMLAFASLHTMPMVGSDVCGFNKIATEKMCARWALLGAFQPFYRNHADISAPAQEFYRWPLVADAAKKAIDARYRLLDYIYTAMYLQTVTANKIKGGLVVQPMWFLYPDNKNTYGIQTQWFLGDAVLVSPVVDDDSSSVLFYLPEGEVFYDFWTFEKVVGTGLTQRDEVGWTDIPVHIRGSTIVPMRTESGMTTAEVRGKNFTIVVAPGKDGKARGMLYLDDGESLDVGDKKSEISFTWDGKAFKAEGTFGYETDVVVESVVILGGEDGPKTRTGPWELKEGFGF